jgi:nucleoid DNA-binding protein
MKKYKHSKIVAKISEDTGLDSKLIHLIIRKFYYGLRELMLRNEEINIKGFFILKLSPFYKRKIEKESKNINLRRRKNQKYTYVKKSNK